MNQAQINILKRIVNNPYPQLCGCIIDNLGRYCFSDSYRVVKLNEAPPGLFHTPPSFSIVRNDSLDRLWHQYVFDKDGKRVYPEVSGVKECAKRKSPYIFEGTDVKVAPGYLYDMMRMFPDAEIYLGSVNPRLKAIRFRSSRGVGYLLPLR